MTSIREARDPMIITPYHAKDYAYELTRRCPADSDDRLASALVDAQVDLNPHQIDAALFAFALPSRAGRCSPTKWDWARRSRPVWCCRRNGRSEATILVITPANLRKQWHQELNEKFFLPCRILDASYNDAIKAGISGRSSPTGRSSSAPISSLEQGRGRPQRIGTWWSSTRPIGCGTSTSRPMSSPTPSSGAGSSAQTAAHRHAAAELPARAVRPGQLHRRAAFGDLKSFREQFAI